ncbi:MAG: octaprenyl diphosphate synthase [Gammaproteobacteria bacterium]|uniref:Octaprenyl diphosphate synthase n=1 Tax=OM182 bacterium TaxID=2510334 RepID=A0A520RXZ2_9GAMM|nr:octaprenyl diphosphate synthase [Gammaproteobacteria bacterium]OUV66949.1 MAG: octaprenyl diphosphate synthase [Gammaproteobacteria bacterium TMED133]RZO75047.1 MAG: octaprenyl diphosphate synthase [OM182 bacterium]
MTNDFFQSVAEDFGNVDQLISQSFTSDIPLVEQVARYLITAGGKRLRPLLVLLCAKACGYKGEDHIKLAVIIEFLHTAMLLHDDVVDASDLRRGRKTVNAQWGNPASVLVGDFLHSRAFEMMVDIGDLNIMEILSHATNTIAEGEVQQLANLRNLGLTEQTYLEVIWRKTAMLFQAASHTAAVLAGANKATETAMKNYGLHLGLAFQLIDDLLDYEGNSENLGKNIGDDLAEGKVTLPLIIAMKNGNKNQTSVIREAIKSGGIENLSAILGIVNDSGGITYTYGKAASEKDKTLASIKDLPSSVYKTSMENLVDFVIQRPA